MNKNNQEIYTFLNPRDLKEPVLILALDGWIDSSGTAKSAKESLISKAEVHTMVQFDTDRLLDHRARRPTLHLNEGVIEDLEWPKIELLDICGLEGPDFCLLQGPEPDHDWKIFAEKVTELCHGLNVSLVVGLGAYPAAVPHTRPTKLSCTASSKEMSEKLDFLTASIKVPAGVQAVIETEAALSGIPAIGIWAQIPHYLSSSPYPPATIALLDGLEQISGISNEDFRLNERALKTKSYLDELIAGNEEHLAMLEKLETTYDQINDSNLNFPSGEDLAEELQDFLRQQENDS